MAEKHELLDANSSAAQSSFAVNGFCKCELEPIDRHVFPDCDTIDVALAEPETQQNEHDKENETPNRRASLSRHVKPACRNIDPTNVGFTTEHGILNNILSHFQYPRLCLKPKIYPNRSRTRSPNKKEFQEEKLQQEQRKAPKRIAKDDKTDKKSKTKIRKRDKTTDDDHHKCFYCEEV